MSSLLPDERGLMTKNYVESHSFNSLQLWPSQVVLVVKKLPTNTGNLRYAASIPGWEDPLEKGMATHSSISAWRIPIDRGSWWARVHGVAKSQIQLSN